MTSLLAGCSGKSTEHQNTGGSAGAGGTTPAQGGGPATTASSSSTVESLSATDAAALCDWVNDQADIEGSCLYVALLLLSQESDPATSLDALRMKCTEGVQECIERTPKQLMQQCDSWFGPGCKATVQDIIDCRSSLATKYAALYADAGTCETLDPINRPIAKPDTQALLSGCSNAIANCPSFFAKQSVPEMPVEAVPAVTQACDALCDRYNTSCNADCPTDCHIERLVYKPECDAVGETFYRCAADQALDCQQDSLLLAVQGCAAERLDYSTCFALHGEKCQREPSADQFCSEDSTKPYAQRCVSTQAPEGCSHGPGAYYCCPSP